VSAELFGRARRVASLALVVTVLGACSWFTDFKEQPKIDPWQTANDSIPFRGNPQNSVPVYGTLAPGYAVSRMALPATVDSMSGIANPVAADARSLVNGRKNYQINCAVCHGPAGKGFAEAPVTKYGIYAPPLASGNALTLTDGYMWGVIRNGRGVMPSYNRIEELDRWDVVNYVRGLQGKFAVGVGPVGLPGETGDKVPGATQLGPTRPSPYYKHVGSQAGPFVAAGASRADSAVSAPTDSSRMGRPAAPATPTAPAPAGAAPATATTPSAGGAR
jgi:mono/diheme cytochrome c family protein